MVLPRIGDRPRLNREHAVPPTLLLATAICTVAVAAREHAAASFISHGPVSTDTVDGIR